MGAVDVGKRVSLDLELACGSVTAMEKVRVYRTQTMSHGEYLLLFIHSILIQSIPIHRPFIDFA